MNRLIKISMLTASAFFIGASGASADGHPVYADFPITLKGYDGTSKTSVSYGGQMARHMLHNGLKKAASSGDLSMIEIYFNSAESVPIRSKSSDKFVNRLRLRNYLRVKPWLKRPIKVRLSAGLGI